MRMWMVKPHIMCNQHLLGEHVELHMIVGSINAEKLGSLIGLAETGCVDTSLVIQRHQEIVDEMISRGMNHKSPLPEFTDPNIGLGMINSDVSLGLLIGRCTECERRFTSAKQNHLRN